MNTACERKTGRINQVLNKVTREDNGGHCALEIEGPNARIRLRILSM